MAIATVDGRGMQISQVAQWRLARNLFAVYAELARTSGICKPPFSSFGADDHPESLEAVEKWFDAVETSLSPEQFRAAIGTLAGANAESALYTVAQHLIAKRRADTDSKKKLEFVLVQYFLVCSPPSFHSNRLTYSDVAEVLQPLIPTNGEVTSEAVLKLQNLAARVQNCGTLRELQEISSAIDECKQTFGDTYYQSAVLVRVTHAQFLLRVVARELVKGFATDLLQQLEELQARSVTAVDCRAAGLSEKEDVAALIAKLRDLIGSECPEDSTAVLVGMEKVLAERANANANCNAAPNAQLQAELASLRSLADHLSTQLAVITQRVQRLEMLVPVPPPITMSEAPRPRPAAPPIAGTPLATRTAEVNRPAEAPRPTIVPPNGATRV